MTMTLEIPAEIREEYEVLVSNAIDVLPREEFIRKLVRSKREQKPLRIKYGADPSAPDIHLGHSVPIRKLRQFQDAGHQVVFIIGGYTARIGDPSGKNSARPRLTKEEVQANARTYLDQIFKILDREKTEVVDNSDWLEGMDVSATIELMSKYTVSQMLEREDFHKRFETETPIFIHEFIYPLLQGYDSVAVRSDVELGGTDQKFNLLVGRELQKDAGQEPQCIMTIPLLVGLDGSHKMSKSLGNYIGVSESAQAMFGKSMSIPDEIMWTYFDLVTNAAPDAVAALKAELESGKRHPRDVKEQLAREIVTLYHSPADADREAADFRARFTLGEFPHETAERVTIEGPGPVLFQDLLRKIDNRSSREIQRLVEQGGIKVFSDPAPHPLTTETENRDARTLLKTVLVAGDYQLKIGKTRFVLATVRS